MTEAAPGQVERYLDQKLRRGPIHFTLIDPEKSPGTAAGAIARRAAELGTDLILLGGSTGISPESMGRAVLEVKKAVRVPVVIFPEGPGSIAPEADALLFLSLLNSRNLDLVIRAHARSALHLRELELETIPMGYLVIAPGMRVGQVGEVDPIARDDLRSAAGYGLAAEMLGMRFLYLEAGSGAPAPVPAAMVAAVRAAVRIPLVVGGGIRSAEDARPILAAGADVLVTGTVTEEEGAGTGFRSILEEVWRARG